MTEIVIAGAGPTGLTTAISLARAGHTVRIVDAAAGPSVGSRGDGLQPRTLEVFDDIGVIDRVLREGGAPGASRVYLDGEFQGEHLMFEPAEPTADRPYPSGWFCGQAHTEEILRDRLAEFDVRVEFGSGLDSFTQSAQGVSALLRTGETVQTEYLVGADGGRSTVRKALGIGFIGETNDDIRMLLGDVRADELDHDFGYMWKESGDSFGIMMSPLPEGKLFQFGAPLAADVEQPGLEYLQATLDSATGTRKVRLDELAWSTVWRPNIRMAERFREGRVFIAGDAAHAHPPTGGQGLNTGIQDGYNLGWKLAAVLDGADESLLNSYEEERLPIAQNVLEVSTAIMNKYINGDKDANKRGENTMQLLLGYPDSALSIQEGTPLAELRAGDRAPDAIVGGETLFELFRGPHSTVIGFDTDVAEFGPHAHRVSIAEAAGYAAEPGAIIVVRPDGYLGYVGTSSESTRRYLAQLTTGKAHVEAS